MTHTEAFLKDLAIIMMAAGFIALVFHRFKQPVVLGYILAGIIIGPHTPPFPLISDRDTIQTMADLGVVFLLFSLGLEFNVSKLKKVGGTALIAGTAEISLMLWAGYSLGRAFGWSEMDAIFLVVALLLGLLLVPRLLSVVARYQSKEMLWLTVLSLCFGFCLLVVELGYSMALGAFVMGAIIAESKQIHVIGRTIA